MKKRIKHKISIIIPIYNVEKYLYNCLDSICRQDYDNFEVIMINDGSTDHTEEICLSFLNKDKRFKLISQDNCGISRSRNNGIGISTGDLILFIDADDYIDAHLLRTVNDNINENDMLVFGYSKKYKNKTIEYPATDITTTNFNSKAIFRGTIGGYVWNKVFRKEIIVSNNIYFNDKIHYSEDMLFVINYIKHCNKFKCIPNLLYYYRMRKSSVSYAFNNKKNLSILDSYKYMIENEEDNDNIVLLKYYYIMYYYKLKRIVNFYNYDYDKKILESKKEVLKSMGKTAKLKIFALEHLNIIYSILSYIKNSIYGLYK